MMKVINLYDHFLENTITCSVIISDRVYNHTKWHIFSESSEFLYCFRASSMTKVSNSHYFLED